MADDLVSLPDLPFSSGFHCFPCFDLANLKYELMCHVQMQVISGIKFHGYNILQNLPNYILCKEAIQIQAYGY